METLYIEKDGEMILNEKYINVETCQKVLAMLEDLEVAVHPLFTGAYENMGGAVLTPELEVAFSQVFDQCLLFEREYLYAKKVSLPAARGEGSFEKLKSAFSNNYRDQLFY